MQTKQLKPGALYAVTRNGRRDNYIYATPSVAVALGPYYLAGPARYTYGGQIRKDERGFVLTAVVKDADGVALLKADAETAKRIEDLLDANAKWTAEAIPETVRDHVEETLKLLQTGERIDLKRLDVPDGWHWEVEKTSHVVGPYVLELVEQRRVKAAYREARLAAANHAQANENRREAIEAELKRRGVETKSIYWTSPSRTSNPQVSVALSTLEKLLGLDK